MKSPIKIARPGTLFEKSVSNMRKVQSRGG
jgi:hypothetical protein